MPNQLPLLFGGTGSPPEVQTLRLSEEAPRFLKRFGPSNLIVDQVPDFINRDHATFRRFIEAYYEWLEQNQNAFGIIDSFMEEKDIDQSIGLFQQDFRAMYLQNFPLQLAIDANGNTISEANFLKNARNFYGSKGTEKAYRFLFRLIYNAIAEVKYPGEDVLKCSHGRWVERFSLKTTNSGGTANYEMAGNLVYQIDPITGFVTASATATEVIQYNRRYYSINEVFVKDIFGTFVENLPLLCNTGTRNLEEDVYPVIASVQVVNGGLLYDKSDPITITTTGDGIGVHAAIEVIANDGSIKAIKVLDSGIGYSGTFTTSIVSNSGNGEARFLPTIGALTAYPGFYVGNNGKLSSNKRIYDAYYYQEFSYALRSEVSFSRYSELYKKLVHPAGFKMFGEVLVKRNMIDSLPFHSELQRYEIPYIGHYTPYRMGTTADLYNAYPNGFNPRGTTYSANQSYGASGGKLLIEPVGFTFINGITWVSATSTGSSNNIITANVFEFARIGETYAAIYLKQIDFDLAGAGFGGTGFGEGKKLTLTDSNANGYTANIKMVRDGLGIVRETGGFTHDAQGKPLGSSGSVEGYIEAQGFSYAYWEIYHHPNIRGIVGLNNIWQGGTGQGSSFASVALKPFFKMPIGYHFHSNAIGTPYEGTTGANLEYGLIESTTLVSPNF